MSLPSPSPARATEQPTFHAAGLDASDHVARVPSVLGIAVLVCVLAAPARAQDAPAFPAPVVLDDIVVTATGRPEARARIPGTVQVIDRERIERSSGKSVTEVLAENGVGFFSEWTPAQTSINIRGGASDGQGRDFRSQVLVLLNGRRAGTANLSKLSLADVERIEVVRGPSSVIYGSQNIGGVINIILKTGRTAPGTLAEGITGSWGLLKGRAQTGGVYDQIDWYIGTNAATRGDYHSGAGGGRMDNTHWTRRGTTGAIGLQINPDHRVEIQGRSDGVFGAGFRGSGGNLFNRDDRDNRSLDATYEGRLPGEFLSWKLQGYLVQDVDEFKWASPVIRSGNLPAPGTSLDYNRRQLDILGLRFQPRLRPWEGNELLLGFDAENSRLRSDRARIGVGGRPLAQVPPQDNNQSEAVRSFYAEDAQRLFGERLTVRGGVRYTTGETSFDFTPNLANQRPRTSPYDALTYSTGATFQVDEALSLRLGASSGFRAPTATELAADFTALGGGRIFGDPSLRPETSRQIEAGAAYLGAGWRTDVALFQNVISDRIVTRLRSGAVNTSDYANNSGEVLVRGVETQFEGDVLRLAKLDGGPWFLRGHANGTWNFDLQDRGAALTANTKKVERIYVYQAGLGARLGQTGGGGWFKSWSFGVTGVLRGPMYYNTEENLIATAEPFREFIHRKSPHWTWNLRAEAEVRPGVTLFAALNNIFDVNAHPIFIATDAKPLLLDPRFANGSLGTSMPGRELQVGLQARF